MLAAADERATVYGGDALRAEERRRAAQRRGRHAELRALLVDGPVLELTPGADFGFTFDPLGVESLAGLGQVHRSLTVTDTWGRLEVTGGPALLLTDEAGMIRGVRVALGEGDGAATAEDGGELSGDGWRLEVAEGWRAVPGRRAGDLSLLDS